MSNYESTFICSPEIPAEKLDELIEKVKKIVESSGGKIALTQQLGKKRLSYPINKLREGSYVYLEFSGSGEMISAIENFYKVNDAVIRYLTVKAEKKKPARQAGQTAKSSAQEVTEKQAKTEIVQEEEKKNE